MINPYRKMCVELLDHAKKAQAMAAWALWFGDEDEGLFDRAEVLLDQIDPMPVMCNPSQGFYKTDTSQLSVATEEVAALAEWLRGEAAEQHPGEGDELPSDMRDCLINASGRLALAADLLEHQYPQPVAIDERLPEPKDLDCEYQCWVGEVLDSSRWEWQFSVLPGRKHSFGTHWLSFAVRVLPAFDATQWPDKPC